MLFLVWVFAGGCATVDPLISDRPFDTDDDTSPFLDYESEVEEDSADTGEKDTDHEGTDTETDTVVDTETYGDLGGSLDDSFGNGGEFLFPSALGDDSITDAVTTPEGSIFLTGTLSNGTDSDLLLMKLTRDGVLDKTFNGTGYLTRHNIAGGEGSDAGYSINLAPDGDLLISGGSLGTGGYTLGFLWKVSKSGTQDLYFGAAGTYLVDIGTNLNRFTTTYDHQTGKILAVGTRDSLIHGFRILANGSGLDTSFGTNGIIELQPKKSFHPVLDVLADGTFLVAGSCSAGGGGDGFWTEDLLGLGKLGRVHDVVVRQDGSIIASLEVITDAGDWDAAVIKLDANGVRDMSFAGGTGVLQLGGAYEDRVPRLIEQPDGRILVFASQYNDTEGDLVMWAIL